VGPQEVLRLAPLPIIVEYKVYRENPTYDNTSAIARQKLEKLYALAESAHPKAYFPPLCPSSAWFQSAEIILDGFNLGLVHRSQGMLDHLYGAAHRLFMSDEDRARYFDVHATVPNEAVRTNSKHPAMQSLYKFMDFHSENDPQTRCMALDMPSSPFLSYPENWQLNSLRGKKFPASFNFLPSMTDIQVNLTRVSPRHRGLEQVTTVKTEVKQETYQDATGNDATRNNVVDERLAITDAQYFSKDPCTNDIVEWKLEITRIYLLAESTKIDPISANRYGLGNLGSKNLNYTFHCGNTALKKIRGGMKEEQVSFTLDKNINLVYVGFLHENALVFNAAAKKFCSNRSIVPSGLRGIRFVYGDETILFEAPLQRLVKTLADGSVDVEMFKWYLKERQWLDPKRGEDFFPRGNYHYYEFVMPLDLSGVARDGPRNLDIHCEFDDDGSPTDVLLYATRVYESTITRKVTSGKIEWDVIPSITNT
jgi:hypothetical protein